MVVLIFAIEFGDFSLGQKVSRKRNYTSPHVIGNKLIMNYPKKQLARDDNKDEEEIVTQDCSLLGNLQCPKIVFFFQCM